MSRKMWVFNSEKQALSHLEHALTLDQMKEIGFANVRISKEQLKLMRGFYFERLFDFDFWDQSLGGENMNNPLHLEIPGEKQGSREYAVAELPKIKRSQNNYYVPVRIYSNVA